MAQYPPISRPYPSYQHSLSSWSEAAWSWGAETDVAGVVPPPPRQRSTKSHVPASLFGQFNGHHTKNGLNGLITFLPSRRDIPADSVIFSQPDVNGGVFAHPAVVLGQSGCGKLVFCGQVTSFSNFPSLQAKYESKSGPRGKDFPAFWKYVAIGRDSPNHMEALLTSGQMQKQSYVNLQGGFWIEWRYLSPFLGNTVRILDRSLQLLQWAYCRAERHREQYGCDFLEMRSRTPSPATASFTSGRWRQSPPPQVWQIPQAPTPPSSATAGPLRATAGSFTPAASTGVWRSTSAPAALQSAPSQAKKFDPLASSWR